MSARVPTEPPTIPGFSLVRLLGSGGFADVFLYEQHMPQRQVAVKVLLSDVVDDHVRQSFRAEADLMARLGSHPSILTVYQAAVSSDGRPYIVMEFCSPALGERSERECVPVPEVLRIAVKVGSAIETAHRSGVLHRDIKPSNILLTAYGHPVLSDFGIASTLGEPEQHELVGMAIPWSAPEVLLDETPGTVRSEVWSLAATVYTLLAGRSPFESVAEANTPGTLTKRIISGNVEALDRPGIPPILERTLQRAMSRNPGSRQQSVLELIEDFRASELALGVPLTATEVAMDDWALATAGDSGDPIRVRATSLASVRPTPTASAGGTRWWLPSDASAQNEMVAASVPALSVPVPWHPARGSARRPSTLRTDARALLWSIAAAILVVGWFVVLSFGAPLATSLFEQTTVDKPVLGDIDPGLAQEPSQCDTSVDPIVSSTGISPYLRVGP